MQEKTEGVGRARVRFRGEESLLAGPTKPKLLGEQKIGTDALVRQVIQAVKEQLVDQAFTFQEHSRKGGSPICWIF